MFKKLSLPFIFMGLLWANDIDEEIIKDLDFFLDMNMVESEIVDENFIETVENIDEDEMDELMEQKI